MAVTHYRIESCDPTSEALDEVVTQHLAAPLAWDPAWTITDEDVVSTKGLMTSQLEEGSGLILFTKRVERLTGFVWAFDPMSVGAAPGPESSLHIGSLWVAPSQRGQGLSRQLVEELECRASASGTCIITSEVHAANTAMQSIQARWGYRNVARAGDWLQYEKSLTAKQ